jgi:hypothetical protein
MFGPTLPEIEAYSQHKALHDAGVMATSRRWVSSKCSNRGKGKKSLRLTNKGKFIQRIEMRNRLKAGCYDHRNEVPGAVGLGKKLAKCIQGVSFDRGMPNAYHFNCKDKACSFCRLYKMAEERKYLRKVIQERVNEGALLSFATLTIRTFRNESPEQTRTRVQKVWSRMIRHPYFRDAVVGAFRVLEVTKKNDTYHAHIHALIEVNPKFSHTKFRELLRQKWMFYGGGFIHTKRVDKDLRSSTKKMMNLVFELSSYVTKDHDLGMKDWVKVAVAGRGKRDFGWMGLWKKLKKTFIDIARAAKGEPIELPPAPNPINDTTGEVAWLPDGRYSAGKLIKLAERGDWSASWAIEMVMYALKWSQHPDYGTEIIGIRVLCCDDEDWKQAA